MTIPKNKIETCDLQYFPKEIGNKHHSTAIGSEIILTIIVSDK